MNKLYIITGPAGVGKSTVSKKIASSLDKSVLIEGDDIYNQFVGGRISPWKENAPLDLFWENCVMLIDNYLKNGYDVVFNYIIKKNQFNKLKKIFKDYEIKFTVLLVDEETIVKRDRERPMDCQMGDRSLILLNEFKSQNYNKDYILDSTNLTINETINEVLNNNKFIVKKMNLEDIKTPEDILEYMKDNIQYGWLDIYDELHIDNTKNCRKLYRTASIEEILKYKVGTCIEQVCLMSYLLDKINIKNKMFCTRIYEDASFNEPNEDEHLHCFVLYYLNDKVYQIEHPNWKRIGIYEFNSEEDAIKSINEYYINMSSGVSRPVTEFTNVKPNLSFKEFNLYINGLDKNKDNNKIKNLKK